MGMPNMMRQLSAILSLVVLALCETEGFVTFLKPVENELVYAGDTYEIRWSPGSLLGDGTLSLLSGDNDNTLSSSADIDTAVDVGNGSYFWDVGSDLGTDKAYGLKLTLNSDVDAVGYGFPFKIAAMDGVSMTSSSETTTQPTTDTTSPTITGDSSASSSQPTQTPTSTDEAEPSSEGDNTTIIGSVVGVGLIVLIGSLVGLVFYYRRKSKPKKPSSSPADVEEDKVEIVEEYKKAELDARDTGKAEVAQVYELDATDYGHYAHEVDATTAPVELDSGSRSELPTLTPRDPWPRSGFPSPLSRPGTPRSAVPPSPMSML